VNFTEWTDKVEAADKAKETAFQRYFYASEIRYQAYKENPNGGPVLEFAQRMESEARKAYETAKAVYDAALNERGTPDVTDSEVPAGDGQSVTDEDDFLPPWLQFDSMEVCEGENGPDDSGLDMPFGTTVECEHSWSVSYQVNGKRWQCCIYCLEEREVQTNWRLEVVEQALQEDSQNER
jgi:hypothetical protein